MDKKRVLTIGLNIVAVIAIILCIFIVYRVTRQPEVLPSDTVIGTASATEYKPSTEVGEPQEAIYITYPGLADDFTLDADHQTLPLYNDESNVWYMDYVVTVEEVPEFTYDTKMIAPGYMQTLDLYNALDAGTYTVHFNIYVSPDEKGSLDSLGTPYDYVGTVTIVK